MSRLLRQIESILSSNRISPMSGIGPRDSDKELIIQLLQANGANLNREQLEVIRSLSFESITRARRKLQEEGKYPPSDKVARQRRLKSYIMQQTSPSASTTGIEQQLSGQPAVMWPERNRNV